MLYSIYLVIGTLSFIFAYPVMDNILATDLPNAQLDLIGSRALGIHSQNTVERTNGPDFAKYTELSPTSPENRTISQGGESLTTCGVDLHAPECGNQQEAAEGVEAGKYETTTSRVPQEDLDSELAVLTLPSASYTATGCVPTSSGSVCDDGWVFNFETSDFHN